MYLNLDTKLSINKDLMQAPNLVERFTSDDLSRISSAVREGYDNDKHSRSAWERRMDTAMDLAMQISVDKNWPWPGCSNVVFPLVTIAALQFSARAYPAIVQGTNVVRYRVFGKDIGEVRERAKRIGRHMSWQVLEEDQAWEEQHDRLLINLAVVGSAFVKSHFDSSKGYPVDELVMARDFVINYWAKSTEAAQRKTHVIPLQTNEVYERVQRGTFCDVRDESWFRNPAPVAVDHFARDKRSGMTPPPADQSSALRTLEQHVALDFDGDGYKEPYVVTIEESSNKVLRIVARFEQESDVDRKANGEVICIKSTEYFTKYSFIPSPDGGIYDLGFGMFLGPINESVDSGINQILDAGTMQNSIGGFLGRGAKIRGGVYTMAPWEWKRVDSTGDDLRKNLVPYPERQPSSVMFQLIGLLIDYANRISGTTDPMVGENPGQNTPASTFQGMTEQGMQVYGMILKRVWRGLKEEFKKRYKLNALFLRSHQDYGQGEDYIRREDYTGSPDQVAPVANPKLTSTQLRVQQAIAVKQDSMTTPGYDVPEVTRTYLEALDVEGIDRLYPGPDKVPPLPNPKMAVEQMKVQVKQAEIKLKQQEWANKLMEERRLNNAKIAQLEAQAYKFMKEAGAVNVELQLKAFDMAVSALKEHGEMINERLKTLTSGGEDSEQSSDSNRGAVPGLAGPSGQPNVSGSP